MLKHVVLLGVLDKLAKKPKNFFILDTHAGEGLYHIENSEHADDNVAMHITGVDIQSAIVARYKSLIQPYLAQSKYPGSPALISDFVRAHCEQKVSFHANELGKVPVENLTEVLRRRAHIHNKDAFQVMSQLLPPQPRRGALLIDPPYEQASEYMQVANAIAKAYSVWHTGICMLWYPLLTPMRVNRKTGQREVNEKAAYSAQLIATLSDRIDHSILDVRLHIADKETYSGMYGSGMCIINPPWQLDEDISLALKDISNMLAPQPNVSTEIQWLREPR